MSYILDALRRADSERERGAVPSLHSKQMPEALADADDDVEPRRRVQPLHWAVGALSLALVGVLLWLFLGRDSPEPAAAPVPSAPPPLATAMPAPQPMPPMPAPVPFEPPPAAAPATLAAAPPPTQPAPAVQRKAPAPAAAQVARAAPKLPPAASAVPERPVQTISELPDDIRRELPQLSVGGAMYSENAASRMLILNGQVFHEGDKVANNLVLEQIKLKSAVLSYRGYRYGISY